MKKYFAVLLLISINLAALAELLGTSWKLILMISF